MSTTEERPATTLVGLSPGCEAPVHGSWPTEPHRYGAVRAAFLAPKTAAPAVEQPYFIITFGPPGSGKSSMMQQVRQTLGVDERSVVPVLIDDILDTVPEYRAEMRRQRSKEDKTATYFKWRARYGDDMSNRLRDDAMRRRLHVQYESTGRDPQWLLGCTIPLAQTRGYQVVVAYPLVSSERLIARAAARAQRAKALGDDDAGGAAREIADDAIRASVHNAQSTFLTIVPHVDHVLFYDNDGPPETMCLWIRAGRACGSACTTCSGCARTDGERHAQRLDRIGLGSAMRAWVQQTCGGGGGGDGADDKQAD